MAIFDLLSETEVKIFENNARDVVRARKLLKKSSYTLDSNKEFSVIVKKMVNEALTSENLDFKKRIEVSVFTKTLALGVFKGINKE